MNLDNLEQYSEIDKSNMMRLILDFPEQVLEGIEIADRLEIPGDFDGFSEILITGMGGSGIPGDFLRVYLRQDLRVPLIVNKEYTVPRFVSKKTLVFAVSYSGTTEETIAAFHATRKAGAKMIGVTSGATLGHLCKEYNVPCVLAPTNRQTRTSFGYLFSSILIILQRLGFVPDKKTEIEETINVLKQIREELEPEVPTRKNIAKKIALKLVGKIPFIYGVRDDTDVVALRWRQQFNENSKTIASSEAFPELDHNETVAFDTPRRNYDMYEMLLLRKKNESPKIRKRIELSKSIFKLRRIHFTEIWSKGVSSLAKLLSLSYTGDFTSIYLAIANGVDPTPVKTIKRIRDALAHDV